MRRPLSKPHETMLAAADLATDHRLGIWDAGASSRPPRGRAADCFCPRTFQDGFAWGGVTVVNPFASPQHPLLQALAEENDE